MLYTKQIPEYAQIPSNIMVLDHFDETSLFGQGFCGQSFCIVVAELTAEQIETIKKHDKCPVYFNNDDNIGFNYALSLAVSGFIQETNVLEQSGLTNTWDMPLLEIDSRLMCSSYIDHINIYRNKATISDVTADTLIAKRLDILEIELNALKHTLQENL